MSRIQKEIHNILHDPKMDGEKIEDALSTIELELVKLFTKEFNALRDVYNPACTKCGARKADVELSNSSNRKYINCLPIGGDARKYGNERHQFRRFKGDRLL